MTYRILRKWDNLQSSLWFIPLGVGIVLMLTAVLFTWIDRSLGHESISLLPFFPEVGAAGAREMLGIIGGSVLTIASVAFSFTIVVFSFASAQYSSRTLRTFMDDNLNQLVLGVLLGSFVYCIVILRSTRLDEDAPVPQLSISFAMILAFLCLALFVLFIHHVGESIQAYHIIARLSKQTIAASEHLFPSHIGAEVGESDTLPKFSIDREAREVLALRSGYIQMVDGDRLMRAAVRYDLQMVLAKSVGNFVITGEVLARVGPVGQVSKKVIIEIEECFVLGKVRTIFQDAQYGILQLSDVAVKALSPGINDPNTAIMSLNHLGEVLRQVAHTTFPSAYRADSNGEVRIFASGPSFDHLAAQAFDQVRRHATLDISVPLKMLDIIGEVAKETHEEARREVLRVHTEALLETVEANITSTRDLQLFRERYTSLASALKIADKEGESMI